MRDLISARVKDIPASALRDFFDILATMDDVISLGIGEPDFHADSHPPGWYPFGGGEADRLHL